MTWLPVKLSTPKPVSPGKAGDLDGVRRLVPELASQFERFSAAAEEFGGAA